MIRYNVKVNEQIYQVDLEKDVATPQDAAIKMDNWMLEISNFENQSWKKNMPSILSEEYSIQNLKNI